MKLQVKEDSCIKSGATIDEVRNHQISHTSRKLGTIIRGDYHHPPNFITDLDQSTNLKRLRMDSPVDQDCVDPDLLK